MKLARLLSGRRRARPVDFCEVGRSVDAALALVDSRPEVVESGGSPQAALPQPVAGSSRRGVRRRPD